MAVRSALDVLLLPTKLSEPLPRGLRGVTVADKFERGCQL